jgi:ketosteroid isomerase-like protein
MSDLPGAIPPSEAVMSWARALYAESVDNKDARGFAAAFTETASLRFGNADPISGRDAIEAAIAHFFETFQTLRHEDRGTRLAGDTLIIEAVVTYKRHDEREVTVPAVTIFHLAGAAPNDPTRPLADECRIYVDLTPLYAPA